MLTISMLKGIFKILILSLISLATYLITFDIKAQEKEKKSENTKENSYIYKFHDKLNMDLFFDTFRFKFNFLTKEKQLIIRPNLPFRTNFALSYKFLRLQFGFITLFKNVSEINNGNTRDINLELDFYIKKFRQIISFDAVRGMYLENTADIDSNYESGQPNLQFPNLSLLIIEGQSSYNFNPNFSHRALDLNNEWQKRSAFSFSPYILYYYRRVRNLPNESNGYSVLQYYLPTEITNVVFNIQPRFYSILVYKENLFLMTMLYPNIGYKYSITNLFNDNTNSLYNQYDHILFWGFGSRIQIGYNSTHFYAGTFFTINQTRFNVNNVLVLESSVYFSIYLGYRFTVPNLIKKAFNKAEMMFNLKQYSD